MAIFICPNCEQRSELEGVNNGEIYSHICPHCGQASSIDKEQNIIIEE